jgi:hypothetical protein
LWLAVLLATATTASALTPTEKCEADKLKAAGKYGFCRLKAEAKAVKTGDPVDYGRCDEKYADKWGKIENKAAGMCPPNGEQSTVQEVITQQTDDVAGLLTDGTFSTCGNCGNAVVDPGEDCDQGNLGGATCATEGFAGGTLACGAGCVFDTSGCSNACPGGQTTSVSGTVYAPNGTLPLPNALVYVPDGPIASLPAGVTCDPCGSVLGATPLAQTVSDASGHFVLPGVPAGANVPLVIQIGKWRRQVVLASVPACADTPLPAGQTRLPRNGSEGDLPQIAVSTGGAGSLECLLRKLGIDDSEFTTPPGAGRVHLFAGSGGTDQFDAGLADGRPFTAATAMWSSGSALAAYDVVLLSCEGSQHAETKPAGTLQAMKDYADGGGRVFMEHLHNYWLMAGPNPWPSIVTWTTAPDVSVLTADVDTTPGHAATFADWLVAVGGSTTEGEIGLVGVKRTATTVDANFAERLIYKDLVPPTVQYLSFTTPVEQQAADRCGRVVFSDLHSASPDQSDTALTFPSGGCVSSATPLSPQDLVLAFMVFDISSCVGSALP